MSKVVTLDRTTELHRKVRKSFSRKAKTMAQDTRAALKRSFKKRSPKKPQKGTGEPLYLYDEAGQKVKPMAEHIRELKKEVRKGGTRYVGKSFATRKRTSDSGARWVDSVFKATRDEPVRTPAPAGSPPFTWRNVNKGVKGHPQSAYPDYFMSHRVYYQENGQLDYEVAIKQWRSSESVFKALEEGGTVTRKRKVLLGWVRHRYAVKSKQRARYEAKYRKIERSVTVRPRPFLKPVEWEMKKKAADYFKMD